MESENNKNNIIGHIAGLTETSKNELYSFLKKSQINNVEIIDVDIITGKIVEDTNMGTLFSKYEYHLERSKNQNMSQSESKSSSIKAKQLEKKMNQYWKVKMEYYLNKLTTNHKKKILLIGFLSFFKNHKICINIDIVPKFFIKVNFIDNAKLVIKYNLDNSRDDIINGNFDLNYLDVDFLVKKRMLLQSIYTKINYIVMSLPLIINTLELQSQMDIPETLYYASFIKYNKKIPIMSTILYAYTQEWLSLSSILLTLNNMNKINDISSNNIEKGIKNNRQYIKLTKLQADRMKDAGYIYEIKDTYNFLPFPTKNNVYKYFTVRPIKINRVLEIDNVIDQLKQLNIDIIIV